MSIKLAKYTDAVRSLAGREGGGGGGGESTKNVSYAGSDPGFCLGGLLLYGMAMNHIVVLLNTSCIRKPQVISVGGGGGAHLLHPPTRSDFDTVKLQPESGGPLP